MRTSAERVRRVFRAYRWLAVVLGVGLVTRAALIPITHGQDFVVWDRASAATLRGINIYSHHPVYPAGPFAYFPLFVYVELPFQWLAQHTGTTFTVWGKLPILAADVACALLIAGELRRRGRGERVAAIGAAMFFLNPLVLYNSAYYGRFDTVACALLLLALRGLTREAVASRRTGAYYASAVAAKTFPVFVLAGVMRQASRARLRTLSVFAVVLAGVSAPYLVTIRPFLRDVVFYDLHKLPGGLSWQYPLLRGIGVSATKTVGYVVLGVFVVAAVSLSYRIADVQICTAMTLVLFLLCSKLVLEQYLIWPLPWLVLIGWERSRLAKGSLALIGCLTVVGMIDNETVHPFGRSPTLLNLGLAAALGMYLVFGALARDAARPESPVPVIERSPMPVG